MQITLPKHPQIKEGDGNRAVFEILELYPGYGVTVGNALRRVLYSSLPGAAITKIKIKGAPHEFSTLPGVLEDVLEIILNLKGVYFKLHGDEEQVATIKIKGAHKVIAKDIETPSQLEVINKDVHIATLTSKDANLEIELRIEPGLGFIPVENQKKERVEIGTIATDAIYTPVRKVNFEVENMRVGDRTDYDKLILEVVTNGAISPEEALERAAELLIQHFEIVGTLTKPAKEQELTKKADKKKKIKASDKKTTTKTEKSPAKSRLKKK